MRPRQPAYTVLEMPSHRNRRTSQAPGINRRLRQLRVLIRGSTDSWDLLAPDAFQHSGVFARRVQFKLEVAGGKRCEFALALLDGKHLVGELEVVAQELVAQDLAWRGGGEHILQAQGTGEDGLEIGDAPLAEFLLDIGGRVLYQHCGEALGR